jgi:hypothetical protein
VLAAALYVFVLPLATGLVPGSGTSETLTFAFVGDPVPEMTLVVEAVYAGAGASAGGGSGLVYIPPGSEETYASLERHVRAAGVRAVKVTSAEESGPGIYTVRVEEYGDSLSSAVPVGTSVFTIGRRLTAEASGPLADWAVTGIELPPATP